MGQKATSVADDTHRSMGTSCSSNVKTLRLPTGARYHGYQEFGVHRSPWTGDEDDDKLIVVRRDSPHLTAKSRGIVSLGALQNTQLCAVCKGIQAIGPACHFELVHLTLSKLKDKAMTCPLCSLLLSALQQPYSLNSPLASGGRNILAPAAWSRTWGKLTINIPEGFDIMRRSFADISIASWPHPQIPGQETYFHVYLAHDGQDHGMCTFSIFKKPDLIASKDIQPRQCQEMIRRRKFDRICAWLAEDVRKMGNLDVEFIEGEHLPARLLDVGTTEEAEACCSFGNHEKGSLRLIHTKDAQYGQLPVPNDARWKHHSSLNPRWIYYAALSHRWGKSTELSSTKKENLQSRFKEIDYFQLCRTFQDAIVVARELRLRYLWIDSLCIVQDDKDDWKMESSIMGDIYYKSFVTLFAHSYDQSSSDAKPDQIKETGCDRNSLNENINSDTEGAKVKAALNEDGGSGFLEAALCAEGDSPVFLGSTNPKLRQKEEFIYAKRQRMFEVDIQNSGLTSRGWIIQERLLSPRVVHFFHSQLFYESKLNGIVRAEDRTPAYSDPDELREYIFSSQTRFGSTPDEWFKVVERFCSCQLTQGSDKLLAIGGIAQKFHTESQVNYFAGLFADRVAKGFLWIRRGPNLTRVHGRAPSWSWASVDGPIRYSSMLIKRPYTVLPEIKVDYSLTNPHEEPKHLRGLDNVKFLSARGFMRKISLGFDCIPKKELFEYSPLPNILPYELDTDSRFRKLLDDNGINIGWVSLDEDNGGELPEADYSAAIVASEEAWVVNKLGPLDILYRTHPPSPEFEAFVATGKYTAEYERLSQENVLPEGLIPRSRDERVMTKTYWVLILTPENLSPEVYTPDDPTDTVVEWKRVGMGQIFEKTWLRQKDFATILLG